MAEVDNENVETFGEGIIEETILNGELGVDEDEPGRDRFG